MYFLGRPRKPIQTRFYSRIFRNIREKSERFWRSRRVLSFGPSQYMIFLNFQDLKKSSEFNLTIHYVIIQYKIKKYQILTTSNKKLRRSTWSSKWEPLIEAHKPFRSERRQTLLFKNKHRCKTWLKWAWYVLIEKRFFDETCIEIDFTYLLPLHLSNHESFFSPIPWRYSSDIYCSREAGLSTIFLYSLWLNEFLLYAPHLYRSDIKVNISNEWLCQDIFD